MANKQNYTPFNIYQKRKMAEEQKSATPLKSIYAKNHNMISNEVDTFRDGIDSGFELAEGQKRPKLPSIQPNKNDSEQDIKDKKTQLPDYSGKE